MSTPDPLLPRLRKVITDAYYDTRNAGGTMERAADKAAAACEEVVKSWLQDHVNSQPESSTDAGEDPDDYDPTPCCSDPGCGGSPCTFPGYADNH